MFSLPSELRFAARTLRKNPGFTTVAVVTLALGVAATSTIFSIVNGILLEPLPYAQPERLIIINGVFTEGGRTPLSIPEFLDLREQGRSFSHIAAIASISANLTGVDEPERVEARGVSPDFFPALGVPAMLGRTFIAADETPGITEIGVISYALWQRRFGGERGAIGRTLKLDDDNYTIVGVMPAGFEHPGASRERPVDFWYPAGFRATPFPPPTRGDRLATVVARLAPGVSLAAAQDELNRFAARTRTEHPGEYPGTGGWQLVARPLSEEVVGNVRQPLAILLGAVGLVLLIACTNVASLQLARGATRTNEIAIRTALGAGRGQVMRQLLAESVVLALAGGVAGLALTIGGVRLTRALAPVTLPRASAIDVDARVLAFALGISLLTGLAFGLIPALVTSRMDVIGALKHGGRSSTTGPDRLRSRGALVVAELALAVVLLAGAGLLIRSFWRLQQVDPGFRPHGLLTLQLAVAYPNQPERGKYVPPVARTRYYHEVLRRVSELPGVESAALVSDLPFGRLPWERPVSVEGREGRDLADLPRAEVRVGSPNYFSVLGIPLLRGRGLSEQDVADAPRVALINQTMAQRLWPGEDPVGQRVKLGPLDSPAPWITIVGIVGDVRSRALDAEPVNQMYGSYLQSPPIVIGLAVRARSAPETLAPAVAAAVRAVERDQPVYAVRTMDESMRSVIAQRQFAMVVLALFAMLALVLASVGIYGLVSHGVTQRKREIGVRMALGAAPREVLRMVLGQGMRLAGAGIAIGLLGAFVLTRALASQLFGVGPTDPLTFLAISIVLLAVATFACFIPGRRAARMDPVMAMRTE